MRHAFAVAVANIAVTVAIVLWLAATFSRGFMRSFAQRGDHGAERT